MSRALKTIGTIVLPVLLAACSLGESAPKDSFLGMVESTGKWSMTQDEKAKYANLSQNDARAAFISKKFSEESARLQTTEEKQMLGVAVYANFKMLQARAIPEYCKGMNVDISAYQHAFESMNKAEEAALSKFYETRTDSFEDLYARYAKRLKTTSKYELMSSGSSYSACTTIRDKTQDMARRTKFSKFYPSVSAAIR